MTKVPVLINLQREAAVPGSRLCFGKSSLLLISVFSSDDRRSDLRVHANHLRFPDQRLVRAVIQHRAHKSSRARRQLTCLQQRLDRSAFCGGAVNWGFASALDHPPVVAFARRQMRCQLHLVQLPEPVRSPSLQQALYAGQPGVDRAPKLLLDELSKRVRPTGHFAKV